MQFFQRIFCRLFHRCANYIFEPERHYPYRCQRCNQRYET